MRVSSTDLEKLRELLKAEYALDYSPEQAQEAGLAILRFVVAKESRRREAVHITKESDHMQKKIVGV